MSDVTPETWLPVVGFGEGFYEVSDLGRVRSLHHGRQRILRPGTSGTSRKKGYPMLILYVDGLREKRFVHKLVAEAFIGPCPEGEEIRHKDGNHQNPAASNLLYGTSHENHMDAVEHGTWFWSQRTQCSSGHEYTEANTYWHEGHRVCRKCRAARVTEWNERNPEYSAAYKRSKRQRRGQWRKDLTHCKHGHEFTPENTIVTSKQRRCRTCKNEEDARYRQRKKG
jgi:hypothetical protein